ncbi:histidinol-phosphatase [Kaistia dalseonensis]|uniref:Histidinol-phosphatase n=1 Tax=Kaistia dalseonensis TaxID=410840 RepID=A0ABU0HD35_9HYPH|nr:histidinol-phosphatase [Kaistia dalseonensis]MCX5496810.1 histidinol-phosphatase [Kaistia dalseonensis]MDQ0439436.1 myo-inositol-1(or 4)-monophosphatase [Kaistia dalseonensis]
MTTDSNLIGFLDRLADSAGAAIMPHFRAAGFVENKAASGFDPVTAGDRAAEQALRSLINENYPDHGIMGEEFGNENLDAENVWVLDPIDGTRAFISGLPVWGTLIGLMTDGKPSLGMMAQPFTGERYAGNGERAWYRGPDGARALSTRPCETLADAILFTTTPALFKGDDRVAYERVESQVRLVRYGCDCYAYCMVAAGYIDAVVEVGLHPYDIVALIPVIEGAGGRVTNWEGGSAAAGGRVVATGDARLHEQILATLNA